MSNEHIEEVTRNFRSCEGFRTSRDVRLESGMRTKADVRQTSLNLWVHALIHVWRERAGAKLS
jgi:hypothetical protein